MNNTTTTGVQTTKGLRTRLTFHESTRGLGTIALWRTGSRYTIETDRGITPVGSDDTAARKAFETAVELHYECPECSAPTFKKTHVCPARD